jgi:hypothetical protein
VIGKYVERLLGFRSAEGKSDKPSSLSLAFLQEHGFL